MDIKDVVVGTKLLHNRAIHSFEIKYVSPTFVVLKNCNHEESEFVVAISNLLKDYEVLVYKDYFINIFYSQRRATAPYASVVYNTIEDANENEKWPVNDKIGTIKLFMCNDKLISVRLASNNV